MARYWELQVLPFIELSPVGFNMINCLKHIYPWWIWLSDSILIYMVVIIVLGLSNVNSRLGPFLALAHTVEVSNFVACLALSILGWAFLSQLVLFFSTSHVFILHPWGFSILACQI